QKDAVTSQLGQMLSGLAGIVPGVPAAPAKPEATKKEGSEERVTAESAN
ncbi:MAG: cell division protein DivIVA, partial [Micromonospora sp.]